jgi:DNA-binding NarL/FixJ family response regulator
MAGPLANGVVHVLHELQVQQEIATLVAEGWTNRQIATRLFISEKTVETHVSHILAKVGVQTRTGLAARLMSGRRTQPFSSA